MTRRLLTAAVLLFATAGMSVASAQPASAHETSDSILSCGGRCGYGGVTNSHTRVYSCDTNPDGIGFRTYYILRNGGRGYIDDANGSKTGCSGSYVGSSSNPIASFHVCYKSNPYICHREITA